MTGEEIGKYVLEQRLGGGHFGEVFLAYDRALACRKALKIVPVTNPSEIMQKLEEAQILDKCRHKHIVQINEANVFPTDDGPILVLDLEYLPEGSLEGKLGNHWISVKEACARMSCVLSGLYFAHSNGYLHRDVKPGNVLLCADSTKLSDFGLATTTLTLVGSDQGYLSHCPPEFYLSNETTIQTDIFAAGLTLFRVANNIYQWRSLLDDLDNTDAHIRQGTLIKTIGFETYIPEKVKRIINKACNPYPEKRYKTALEMKNALDSLRFDIEWIKNPEGVWAGCAEGSTYELSIASVQKGRYGLTYKKKDRRDNSKCSTYENKREAHEQADLLVAQTTLK
ncbi:serine/threonine-protein kinase [Citrifermentans bremense]|uniref:serine/threonine-protein kinase n=1 Tax=Citrifermentans bremense TaxID=60035 RepID=UPI0004242547|nr:serine/threonine-protein kinase [Citrifermentans bremense]